VGLTQASALAEPRQPAVILLLGDGEETVENPEAAVERAGAQLKAAGLPLFALAFGQTSPCAVPGAAPASPAPGPAPARGNARPAPPAAPAPAGEPAFTTAHPDLLKRLAERTGGRLLAPGEDPAALFLALAQGREPLPLARSLTQAHPEWGAWLALAGLALWLLAAGRPMRAWRTILLLALALGLGAPARAASGLGLPAGIRAWAAQAALERDDLERARRWLPAGDTPAHRLLAAEIELRSGAWKEALAALEPLTGQGSPRPLPAWRAPALLLAARAQAELGKAEEARTLLERLLLEQPGQPEAIHNLQSLLKDPPPTPPPPRNPPPPPPPRPSQGARQDELDGLRQRLPEKPKPSGGVKDL
jgi:tetratricopeptide (TPR) repeat protein